MQEGTTDTTPSRCPLCAGDNACGAAAGEAICWCFTARIPPEVRERIPPDARGVACICRACANQDNARASAQPTSD